MLFRVATPEVHNTNKAAIASSDLYNNLMMSTGLVDNMNTSIDVNGNNENLKGKSFTNFNQKSHVTSPVKVTSDSLNKGANSNVTEYSENKGSATADIGKSDELKSHSKENTETSKFIPCAFRNLFSASPTNNEENSFSWSLNKNVSESKEETYDKLSLGSISNNSIKSKHLSFEEVMANDGNNNLSSDGMFKNEDFLYSFMGCLTEVKDTELLSKQLQESRNNIDPKKINDSNDKSKNSSNSVEQTNNDIWLNSGKLNVGFPPVDSFWMDYQSMPKVRTANNNFLERVDQSTLRNENEVNPAPESYFRRSLAELSSNLSESEQHEFLNLVRNYSRLNSSRHSVCPTTLNRENGNRSTLANLLRLAKKQSQANLVPDDVEPLPQSSDHGTTLNPEWSLSPSQLLALKSKLQPTKKNKSSSIPLNNYLKKTKICFHYLNGVCTRGEFCIFAHSEQELRPPPKLYKTKLCIEFIRSGKCPKRDQCRFAHGEEDLRSFNYPTCVTSPQHRSSIQYDWDDRQLSREEQHSLAQRLSLRNSFAAKEQLSPTSASLLTNKRVLNDPSYLQENAQMILDINSLKGENRVNQLPDRHTSVTLGDYKSMIYCLQREQRLLNLQRNTANCSNRVFNRQLLAHSLNKDERSQFARLFKDNDNFLLNPPDIENQETMTPPQSRSASSLFFSSSSSCFPTSSEESTQSFMNQCKPQYNSQTGGSSWTLFPMESSRTSMSSQNPEPQRSQDYMTGSMAKELLNYIDDIQPRQQNTKDEHAANNLNQQLTQADKELLTSLNDVKLSNLLGSITNLSLD